MGACIGKKSNKYLQKKQIQSKNIKIPEIIIQDDKDVEKKPSPISSQISLNQEVSPINDDDNEVQFRESIIEKMIINSELQLYIDEQDRINQTLSKPFTKKFVSTTDTEFENELAELIFEQMSNDSNNNSPNIPVENSNNTK